MPMFVTFAVADLRRSEAFYHAAGFATLATVPAPGGSPAVVHMRGARNQDVLLVPAERVSSSVTFAAHDRDLAALGDALTAAGATVDGPRDTAWFTTDLTATDPDGNTVVFTRSREADAEAAREWAEGFEMG